MVARCNHMHEPVVPIVHRDAGERPRQGGTDDATDDRAGWIMRCRDVCGGDEADNGRAYAALVLIDARWCGAPPGVFRAKAGMRTTRRWRPGSTGDGGVQHHLLHSSAMNSEQFNRQHQRTTPAAERT